MSASWDTSAVVKLYADEADSDAVRAWPQPVISALTVTEVVSALWGKVRMGELEPAAAGILDRRFSSDCDAGRFVIVALSSIVVERSCEVARRHRLRGADSLQLATALAVREADPSVSTVAAFDAQLRAAAAAESFVLLPATT